MSSYLPRDGGIADLESLREQAKSLYAVRRALGALGLLVPALMYAYARVWPAQAGRGMQPSISEFYHTHMGDILVGGLASIGVFLLSYKGYERKPGDPLISDFWASTLAGIGALGVALFPVTAPGPLDCPPGSVTLPPPVPPETIQGITGHPSWLHPGSAILFFAAITYMCVFLFPKGPGRWRMAVFLKPENAVYAACGAMMLAACIGLAFVFGDGCAARWNATFWFETLGIVAFAVAWLVKGKALVGMRNLMR